MFIFIDFGSHGEERGFIALDGFFMYFENPTNFLNFPI
jgi:hypothetical protein